MGRRDRCVWAVGGGWGAGEGRVAVLNEVHRPKSAANTFASLMDSKNRGPRTGLTSLTQRGIHSERRASTWDRCGSQSPPGTSKESVRINQTTCVGSEA